VSSDCVAFGWDRHASKNRGCATLGIIRFLWGASHGTENQQSPGICCGEGDGGSPHAATPDHCPSFTGHAATERPLKSLRTFIVSHFWEADGRLQAPYCMSHPFQCTAPLYTRCLPPVPSSTLSPSLPVKSTPGRGCLWLGRTWLMEAWRHQHNTGPLVTYELLSKPSYVSDICRTVPGCFPRGNTENAPSRRLTLANRSGLVCLFMKPPNPTVPKVAETPPRVVPTRALVSHRAHC
jgi:hypothetical protein